MWSFFKYSVVFLSLQMFEQSDKTTLVSSPRLFLFVRSLVQISDPSAISICNSKNEAHFNPSDCFCIEHRSILFFVNWPILSWKKSLLDVRLWSVLSSLTSQRRHWRKNSSHLHKIDIEQARPQHYSRMATMVSPPTGIVHFRILFLGILFVFYLLFFFSFITRLNN